ncbi:hypothetical protein [Kitasatospora sp. NPDC090308]|uniref:hypothetical protein n=1 Tax=Kitasatospora sp. NPDC090308 TaxID=3364082 RepID=UPI00380D2897
MPNPTPDACRHLPRGPHPQPSHPQQDEDAKGVTELTGAERVALVAVCALAASMPGTVLGYCPPELDALTGTLTAAVRTGQGT